MSKRDALAALRLVGQEDAARKLQKAKSSKKPKSKAKGKGKGKGKKQGSALEVLFVHYWKLFAPKRTPQPEPEQCLIPGRRFRCDFVWRAARLVVEIDGGQWAAGGGRHNTDADREKMNLLALAGWKVLRYSGSMLKADPEGMIRQVVSGIRGVEIAGTKPDQPRKPSKKAA